MEGKTYEERMNNTFFSGCSYRRNGFTYMTWFHTYESKIEPLHAMKVLVGRGNIAPLFLNLALVSYIYLRKIMSGFSLAV
jgi:hypothetical protein